MKTLTTLFLTLLFCAAAFAGDVTLRFSKLKPSGTEFKPWQRVSTMQQLSNAVSRGSADAFRYQMSGPLHSTDGESVGVFSISKQLGRRESVLHAILPEGDTAVVVNGITNVVKLSTGKLDMSDLPIGNFLAVRTFELRQEGKTILKAKLP